MTDLAFLLEPRELADGFLERHVRVDAMQLVKIDALELQSPQAPLTRLAQMLRPTVRHPLCGARAHLAALGRDHQTTRIRMQRLGDETLADVRAVSIRGVDEIDAELERTPQHPACLGRILRLTPDGRPGDAHRTEPHAVDREVAADREGPRRRSRCSAGGVRALARPEERSHARRSTQKHPPSCQSPDVHA